MKNQKQRMLAGELYMAADPELRKDNQRNRRLTYEYNLTQYDETERRVEIIQELLGKIGKNGHIEPPFRCDYGNNIYIGDNFYANFDCVILDICEIHIGNNVMFGPRVHLYAASHPIDTGVRDTGLEFGKPITIGNSVWVGGSTVINPGVTIGDNVIIGSGSVVTKDIPSNVIAAGNPCRVIREITDEDKKYWQNEAGKYHREMGN